MPIRTKKNKKEGNSIDQLTKVNRKSYYKSVNCDRPGECSPEKDCLW